MAGDHCERAVLRMGLETNFERNCFVASGRLPPELAVSLRPIAVIEATRQNHPMRQSSAKAVWWTVLIGSSLAFVSTQVWAVSKMSAWVDGSFGDLRNLEGFILWCVATGLTYQAVIFASAKAHFVEAFEGITKYSKTLKAARAGALILLVLGAANLILWGRSIAGMSPMQLFILTALPCFIGAYYMAAYGHPVDP